MQPGWRKGVTMKSNRSGDANLRGGLTELNSRPEKFNFSQPRIFWVRCFFWASATLITLIINPATNAQTQSSARAVARPDLIGQVTASDAFPKATIFIFTAGPKVG